MTVLFNYNLIIRNYEDKNERIVTDGSYSDEAEVKCIEECPWILPISDEVCTTCHVSCKDHVHIKVLDRIDNQDKINNTEHDEQHE